MPMFPRAERLADPAFFSECQQYQDWIFAQLPVSAEVIHGLLFNKTTQQVFCSCPFQPKPCVHALAFEQLVLQQPSAVFSAVEQVPNWVEELRKGGIPTRLITGTPSRETQQQKRHLERLERAERGFQDLELWLFDTLRRGLATAVSEDPDFYKNIASRLADASMRGLSRNFRLLETIPQDHPDWAGQTLAVLADAALALQAFRVREQLPEALISDLESVIGIALKKEAVLAEGEQITDHWAVTGAREEQVEAQLRLRRTWLLGAKSNRFALLLEYIHGHGATFLPGFEPGAILEGLLVFYPSAWPQRALAPESPAVLPARIKKLPGFDLLDEMTLAYAAALGKQPWLTQFPIVLNDMLVYRENKHFRICDQADKSIPLITTEAVGWSLLALGGGQPLTVFGEWMGDALQVMSAVAEERFVRF
ncbi:MAG: hypothetical protein KDD14_04725 [Saprospiraceae bacterium]|nr:hypothetical protein [Saprospiraceae bacterium]